jgi:hypothetical protein
MRSITFTAVAISLCAVAGLSATTIQDNPPSLDTYNGCPMIGDGQSAGVQALNRLKNRYMAPSDAQINPKVTLNAMLAPGADTGRWKTSYGAEITGYVEDVKPGGIETVNCHAKDLADRDTHIELVLDPMNSGSTKRVIVEVTPRWRSIEAAQNVTWSTAALRTKLLGRWVKVRGWMLFDVEHTNASENTAPSNPRDWRGTAWEIHPITSLQVLPGRP